VPQYFFFRNTCFFNLIPHFLTTSDMEQLASSLGLCHRLATELGELTNNDSDFVLPLNGIETANQLSDRLLCLVSERRSRTSNDFVESNISHILTTNAGKWSHSFELGWILSVLWILMVHSH
jgi:hypothetical protein